MKILVSPIVFNEEKKIEMVVTKFNERPSNESIQMIVMDDASTDSSREVVKKHGLEVVSHETRQGVGAAIRTMIRYAQENQYDVLVIMAGNAKDDPAEVENVTNPITRDGYDFVQGSRYLKEGQYGNMPFYRLLATRYLHPFLFSCISGQKITDSTNGFRAFRLSLFQDDRFELDQDWLNQYELEPYLFYKAIRLGYKVTEAPVSKIYPPHHLGYTKMKPITGWWSILRPLLLLGLGIKK